MTDEEVVAAYRAGRTLQSLADELGCHRNTVRNRLITLGIPRRDRSDHLRGVPKTAAHRAKISEAMKAAHGDFPRTDEWKAKISASKRKTSRMSGRPTVYVPGRGRLLEHRWVMEQTLGRRLASGEHVHHINGDITDNRPENLELITPREHGRLHSKQRWASGQMEQLRQLNTSRPRDSLGRFT